RILAEATNNAQTFPPVAPARGEAPRIQERLSHLLDAALYDATIAGEIRSLAHTAENVERIFAELVRVASDVATYRSLALKSTNGPLYVHAHPAAREGAEREARAA